jgi:O-antigen ligase
MKANSPLSRTDLALSWVIAGILVLLPFHAVFTTWLGSNFGHLDLFRIWKELILASISLVVLWEVWKSPKIKYWLVHSWIVRLYLLYVLLHIGLGLLALHRHDVNQTAFIYALLVNLRFIGFFIICYIVAANNDFLKKNWRFILLAPAAIVILFGLTQRFILPYDFLRHFGYGPDTIPAYQTVDSNIDYRRIQSTLRGANPLGAYLVLIIPAIFVGFKKYRKATITCLLAAFTVLFYSYSRSAWVGVAIALALIIWWAKSYNLRLREVAVGVIILMILVVSVFLLKSSQATEDTLFHTSSTSTSSVSSNEARSTALKDGLSDVVHEPLGRGPGTAGPASFRNERVPRIAENYYLQIGQETGLIGMALFIAINVLVAMQLWQKRTDTLAKILIASFFGLVFVNMVSHAWTDDTLAYLWWGFAGICLAPAILDSRHKQNEKA